MRAKSATLIAAAILILLFVPSLFSQAEEQVQAPDASSVVGQPAGPPLAGAELDLRSKEVASELRCPVCQGLSVNDSPAAMAVNMKHQVRDLLSRGYSREQILQYFEASYGQFVRLDPEMRGFNWVVWLAPIAVLVIGALVVWMVIRKMRARPDSTPAIAEEQAEGEEALDDPLPADAELAGYVLKVRELAYGWPDGRRPVSAEGETL